MHPSTSQKGFIPLLVIIAVAAVAAIGGGVYYSHKKAEIAAHMSATTTADADLGARGSVNANVNANVKAGLAGKAMGSLRSLFGMGGSNKCTITNTLPNGGTSSGTVYVSGSMMRGDFTTTVNGAATESHMIRNQDDVYVWTGSQGAKMNISSMTSAAGAVPAGAPGAVSGSASGKMMASTQSPIGLDQDVSYDCQPWTPSDAEFKVPTSVSFIDVAAMMKGQMKIPGATVNTSANGTVNAY